MIKKGRTEGRRYSAASQNVMNSTSDGALVPSDVDFFSSLVSLVSLGSSYSSSSSPRSVEVCINVLWLVFGSMLLLPLKWFSQIYVSPKRGLLVVLLEVGSMRAPIFAPCFLAQNSKIAQTSVETFSSFRSRSTVRTQGETPVAATLTVLLDIYMALVDISMRMGMRRSSQHSKTC